mmetsp:Transcript_30722/g.65255  ORF Transcript_30722/g.65255 Transcript_30722/m.65255 type:complete len:117 (+) Transcript_30722:111-461(+)
MRHPNDNTTTHLHNSINKTTTMDMATTIHKTAGTEEDAVEAVEDVEKEGATTTTATTTTPITNPPTIHPPNSSKIPMHTTTTPQEDTSTLNNTNNAPPIHANTTKTCGTAIHADST